MRNDNNLSSIIFQLRNELKATTLHKDLPQDLTNTIDKCNHLAVELEELSTKAQIDLNKALCMQRTIMREMYLENTNLSEKEHFDLMYSHKNHSALAYILTDYLCNMNDYIGESEAQ